MPYGLFRFSAPGPTLPDGNLDTSLPFSPEGDSWFGAPPNGRARYRPLKEHCSITSRQSPARFSQTMTHRWSSVKGVPSNEPAPW
jgi:hypothetical protein